MWIGVNGLESGAATRKLEESKEFAGRENSAVRNGGGAAKRAWNPLSGSVNVKVKSKKSTRGV
jgi:hypothetical protein